jgi:hypothetical protein
MPKEILRNEKGHIVLVMPGIYLTEYHNGYDVPSVSKILEESPGVVLEDFVDRKLILVNDGITHTKVFVENSSIKELENND